MVQLYFPHDEFNRGEGNFCIAADYLELTAFFREGGEALTADLISAYEIGADRDYANVDEEMRNREEIVSTAVAHLLTRAQVLGDDYPFQIDDKGLVVRFGGGKLTCGQAAYINALILSHLSSCSAILSGSEVYPTPTEIRYLREYFQYFATAALAAEICGAAWSFGWPRPDRSEFHDKMQEIWGVLKDGIVSPMRGAPRAPKDDQVDIFAARVHDDGLPGFLMAAAQVATGANWKDKSLRGHIAGAFQSRWFSEQPVTHILCYHIVPFDRGEDEFFDDVRILGNVLHRLRVPKRVGQAQQLFEAGTCIEAFPELEEAITWLSGYANRTEQHDAA